MATILKPKNHEEWLEIRKSGIGSSEVGTIIGVNPFQTPYQLWRLKTGRDEPQEENFAMKAGHYLEDAVSRFWQDATGREIIKSSAAEWIIRDDAYPFMQVSPDRMYWLDGERHSKQNRGILECKTTQKTIDEDNLPKYWLAQVQYQLGVSGLKQGSLAWLSQGRNFGYRDIEFNPEFFEWLKDMVCRFHNDYIVNDAEPPVFDSTDTLMKYPQQETGKCLEAGDDILKIYNELKDVREELYVLDERKSELENILKTTMEDAESLSCCGKTLATFRATSPGCKFDVGSFTNDHPELASQYMKQTSGSRRFLLK